MFIEGYSFPHPVLGNDDDLSGEFNFFCSLKRTDDRKIRFDNFNINITNNYIKQQLDNGDAGCYLRVYCSSTLRTWMIEIVDQLEIDEDELINKIDVQILVITKRQIENYVDSSFNAQYGNEIFVISKNEVIGITGKLTIPIPKVNERLGLGNIFKFNFHETDKPMYFEFHHDKIFINYPVTKKGEHPPNMLFSASPWTAFSIFILPALSDALKYLEDNPDEIDKWEWSSVIDQLLPEEQRTGNHFSDAQVLLKRELPVHLAYNELIVK